MNQVRKLEIRSRISEDIARYRRLRRFQGDARHCQQLRQLQHWQSERLRQTYHSLFKQARTAPLMQLFLSDIFQGIDIPATLNDGTVNKVMQRFFKGTDMLCAVLEFNALTGEIDQALTEMLFENLKVSTIDEENYLQACQRSQIYPALRRQKELILLFADDLNHTLKNKVVLATIKLAKYPVQMIGLGSLYQLIDKGFAALKKTDNPERLIDTIVTHEKLIIDRMEAGESPVFIEFLNNNDG